MGKIPWRRKWQPTPVFLAGKSHGGRSLVGYSPWGHKESDMTEQHTQVTPPGWCSRWCLKDGSPQDSGESVSPSPGDGQTARSHVRLPICLCSHMPFHISLLSLLKKETKALPFVVKNLQGGDRGWIKISLFALLYLKQMTNKQMNYFWKNVKIKIGQGTSLVM